MSSDAPDDAEIGRAGARGADGHAVDDGAPDDHAPARQPVSAGPEPADEAEADPFEVRRAREFRRAVLRKSVRHSRARRERRTTVWSYLGVFGLVGWTVAVPALLGLALGLYLDGVWETTHSFTITFLVVGVTVGCAMAWYWIRHESQDR